MKCTCGCCAGIEILTPAPTANRPGLPMLSYRVGTHASFFETMLARLSSSSFPELAALKTRDSSDPAIALLDGWALVADVLTFYQERIANEGYLRTAVERRSILEMARLIGYTLRPGVASTAFLAYTMDEDRSTTPPKPTAVTIPLGSRAQSVPGPGELPQSFESSDELEARSEWNNLQVRLTQPQTEDSILVGKDRSNPSPRIYLKGVATNLKQNDPLLIVFSAGELPQLFRVIEVTAEPRADRTLVKLQKWIESTVVVPDPSSSVVKVNELLEPLLRVKSLPPASSSQLRRDISNAFTEKSDTGFQLLKSLQPALSDSLSTALANAHVTSDVGIKVYALRLKAAPFGNNAPKRTKHDKDSGEVTVIGEWPVVEWPHSDAAEIAPLLHEDEKVLYLDSSYENLLADSSKDPSWIVIDTNAVELPKKSDAKPQVRPAGKQSLLITSARNVLADITRADYGISVKTTRIQLSQPWLSITSKPKPTSPLQAVYDLDYQVIRRSAIYAQSERLDLAEEPITDDICHGRDIPIELNGLYVGLESGRWMIVSGERTDIAGTSGVRASELVMLAGVRQTVKQLGNRTGSAKTLPDLSGDRTHTFIQLSDDLAYCYKRESVLIYGNVVKATHGETRNEVLGSGDGSKALQQFALRQPPLTFVSAANPTGVDSTLVVRVNDIQWHETASLAGLAPKDRKFITKTDDDGKTTVIFGNGWRGARLPTGQENVKAVYRNGIGKPGNVKADQITLLASRPLGVKAVTNPLRASGGADKENRDQARKNAPVAVTALDRLVSTQDYADFARTFAGIGKASAARLPDGQRQVVYVTIAGADDIPIEKSSDLYRNLVKALHDFGDPFLAIQVELRELLALVISANVRIMPDYQWESVEPKIRATLLDVFGFESRELGQTVFLSEVISAIQKVAGVEYVDVDLLNSISEAELSSSDQLKAKLDQLTATTKPEPYLTVRPAESTAEGITPGQLAFLMPGVPDTLILKQVTR